MKLKNYNITLGRDVESRGVFFKIVIIGIFFIIMSRIAYLQIYKSEKYIFLAQKNRIKLRRKDASRGNIYGSNKELIVTNTKGYRLVYLNKHNISDKELDEISELTGFEKESLKKMVKYGEIVPYTQENILVDDLDRDKAHKIMEKINKCPYLEIQEYSKRKYIYDSLAAHTLGYVKKITKKEYDNLKSLGYTQRDIVGKSGIEKTYDMDLKGEIGYDYIEVNALNVAKKIEKNKKPIPGSDIHLTIDMRLQQYMEDIFREENLSGSFIALDPSTGKVITIVSYPTYSLNMFSSRISHSDWNTIVNDPRKILTNKSIAGEYPPGSVFKPFSAFGFFNEGLKPETSIQDNGKYTLGKWTWRSWKQGGHGKTNFEKSIIESVNTYYYKYADTYGLEPIKKVADSFGFGKLTKIDISGERDGVLPDAEWKKNKFKEKWYKGDTITLAIGQSYLLTTPMQIAVAYMGIANKGVAYVPHVVDYLQQGNKKQEISPKVLYKTNYPKWYYNALNKALIKTVEQDNGTTKSMRTEGLVIAAKSGSSQNARFKETHAIVSGYFPADKNPKVVFTGVLEGAGGGGKVAGSVAKKFVDKYLELYEKKEIK